MKLAIVGSTALTESQRSAVEFLVNGLLMYYEYACPFGVTVVSGGAGGVDKIAEDSAKWLTSYDPVIFKPRNQCWQPNGYKERNLLIARECDELVSIRSQQSKTYGSDWTADRAEEMGKRVWRYYV